MDHSIEMQPTWVMVIDDHILVAEGIKELLTKILPLGSKVHVAPSTEKAVERLNTGKYGVILTDLIIPGERVTDFIKFCRRTYNGMIILVVSSAVDTNSIKACLAAGANGFLSKAIDLREMKLALEYTMKGRKFISSDLSGKLADSILFNENTTLTNKEIEVLRMISAGHSTKKVAEILFVSPITIMSHKRNIMRKLELHSVTEMVKYAYENNLT